MTKTGIDGLRNHLNANEHIQTVYFDKAGEWQFHSRKKYHIEVDRDEVLEPDFYPDGVIDDKAPVVEPAKPLTALALIALINDAETEEEVTELLGTDTRATVKKAATDRIKALDDIAKMS